MRFKLLRRRLSISAPRMIVRSRLPWPLRWAVYALALGISAAIALWAFEFSRDFAGLERGSREEVSRLHGEMESLREQNERSQGIANTADSLLKAEKAAQERLAAQLKQVESENLSLRADLRFFERLLPATGGSSPGAAGDGVAVRGFQAEPAAAGQLRYQLLVVQNGRQGAPFDGRYEVTMTGQLDGKPWTAGLPSGTLPLQVKQYARVEGRIEHPINAVIKTVQVRVLDGSGAVKATESARL